MKKPFIIIPAIDILNGKAVRLFKGDYNQATEYGSPIDMFKKWQQCGAKRIHIVDLDGAREGKMVNKDIIEELAKIKGDTEIELGGGIRTYKSAQDYINGGIDYIILGSIIVKDPNETEKIIKKYSDKIIFGLDCENGICKLSGWIEQTNVDVKEMLKDSYEKGVTKFIITDIAKDGTLEGPAVQLYKSLPSKKDMEMYASGGIGNTNDIKELQKIKNVSGCIVGKALYDNKISETELWELLK
ncbi:1-(5-phosphoribosyl)-5-[(5-phosphoribosylamino)methylideneamino]imidazole-4-carboxamide isomerase [Candidatus Margulisiibacteriota bacterium]